MFGLEAIFRNGVPVGHLRRSDYGFFIDKTIGYGYIRSPDGGVVNAFNTDTYTHTLCPYHCPLLLFCSVHTLNQTNTVLYLCDLYIHEYELVDASVFSFLGILGIIRQAPPLTLWKQQERHKKLLVKLVCSRLRHFY